MEKGQLILIDDLEALLTEAKNGQFGDFTNSKYAAPKMVLCGKLHQLRENVIAGKYD